MAQLRVRSGMSGAPVVVSLLGARMHYAVPRVLYQAGLLEMLFTDLCALKGWPRLLRCFPKEILPAEARRILSRVPEGIPAGKITAFTELGLAYARRRTSARSRTEVTRTFLWANQTFCEKVCCSDWGAARSVFTFNCAGLEILQRAKEQRLTTVMEQTIAPSAVERRLLLEERALHAGWEEASEDSCEDEYSRREQREWPLADLILCGSDFVREGIRQCGGPVERCIVVPYGVDLPETSVWQLTAGRSKRGNSRRPLRVLTVGTVGLRKGAPYVLEAAKRLKGEAEFRWVGGGNLLPEAASALREHVMLTGSVPRTDMPEHYRWADVFLLPSICEGSATATYEALAWGVPVICTLNTGSVVRDGREGFVVPIRDADAIVDRVRRFSKEPHLIDDFSHAALELSREFTVRSYGQALLRALGVSTSVPRP